MTEGAPAPAALVEAVLLVSPRPVGVEDLASAVGLAAPEVRASLEELGRKYGAEGSGIVLREAGGGFLLATNPLCAPAVERFRREARPAPLSGAALEVLSCVLYLGPATRSAVSKVRGVNSDAVVRNLLDRGLLEEAGREGEGGPALLRVTEEFFVAADARDREDFAPLEDLVPPQALARLRERLGAAGPGFPTSPDTSATGDPASERRG